MKEESIYVIPQTYAKPLPRIPKRRGFGYYGALLQTDDGELMQCHVCGKWFRDVGSHSAQAHKLGAIAYREKFKLAYRTALISEKERQARKQRTLEWLKTITKEQLQELRHNAAKGRAARSEYQPRHRLETKNKRGTCPRQLLNKIIEVKKKIGKTPTLHEFIMELGTQKYKHLIFQVFGSWNKALSLLRLQPRKPITTLHRTRPQYTDEELLEYLQIYTQENNKIPTATDCRRGLLPTYEVFLRRWGNMEAARQKAEVYKFLE